MPTFDDGAPISPGGMPPTYATLDEGTSYFQWAIPSDAWDNATDVQRSRALVAATRLINRLNFAGLRTSDFNRNLPRHYLPVYLAPTDPGQPLEFPRNGDTLIPQDVKDACCELAYNLLDGVDPEQESVDLAAASRTFAGVTYVSDGTEARMGIRHGIVSINAWQLLLPYLSEITELTLRRVS